VPERVPFRMTQNLETALGLTGVEVVFILIATLYSMKFVNIGLFSKVIVLA